MPLGGIEPPSSVPKTDALSVKPQRRVSGRIIHQMADFTQTIEEIEKEIRETPYHKGTEHHIGKLRARLARLKDRQIEQIIKKGGGGGGYAVKKEGDASVVLVGHPSVGKSTLLNALTNAKSKTAPYAFTTVSVIPGMMLYKSAYIQILDVPGLIEGAEEGKGRGREVLSVARATDLLLIMTDLQRKGSFKNILNALEKNGIRVNKTPPQVVIDKKPGGGVVIRSNVEQEVGKETIKDIALEFGLKNAEITIKEKLSLDGLIDAFAVNRVWLPAIFVVNKSDLLENSVPFHYDSNHGNGVFYISAQKGIGLEGLKEKIYESLNLVRIYLVREGEEPGFENPIVMKEGQTLLEVAEKIGTEFAEGKNLAKIWGSQARFPGQETSLTTKVTDGLQIRFI